MSLISTKLLLFVFAAVFIYYTIPKKYQWVVLLVASYLFYASYGAKNISLIIFTTCTTFLGGSLLNHVNVCGQKKLATLEKGGDHEKKKLIKAETKRNKRIICAAVLIINFGILAFLKYFNFIAENVTEILFTNGDAPRVQFMNLMLPIGISFYTFQSMGYIIDVYQGKYSNEKNILKFALFVSFFPQIMQGPIGRYDKLSAQFFQKHQFNLLNFEFALQLVFWGFFKKIVLADRAAVVVNEVFNNYGKYSGFYIIFAVVLYSVELYADFSGGIDIVLGISQMFSIQLDQNFQRPFFSHSISEFWRRWHITLGTWMKDYIFYPFSLSKKMNKFGKFAKKKFGSEIGRVLPICVADLLIFFLVGVWHGAAWKYIAYGMYNGIIIAFSSLLEPVYKKVSDFLRINRSCAPWRIFQIIRTGILVNIAWYFDIAQSFSVALEMIKSTLTGLSFHTLTDGSIYKLGLTPKDFKILIAGCGVWFVISLLQEFHVNIRESLYRKPLLFRWAVYFALIFATPIFGYIGATTGFIYAQF